jgi:hypothetical protein
MARACVRRGLGCVIGWVGLGQGRITSLSETQPDQDLWLLRRVNIGVLDGLPTPQIQTLPAR